MKTQEEKYLEFIREKLHTYMKLSNLYFSELVLNIDKVEDDYLLDTLTIELAGYIYTHSAEKRILTYYCPRPKFLDWLLRRAKKVEWELDVKDLLLNPPQGKDPTKRIYLIERHKEEK